jgi:hypothetical protein
MPWTGVYVLEVLRHLPENQGSQDKHVGYMRAKFKTKEDACSYYDRYNPHMRRLNAYNTYASDWDPATRLWYVVRKDYGIHDTFPPFSEDDLPITGYTYLK